jgi:hypothetical protein
MVVLSIKMRVLSIKTFLNFCLMIVVLFSTISCNFEQKKEINLIFEKTSRIEILAFINRNEWNEKDINLNYIKNGKIELKDKYLKNRISLNAQQIKKLKKSLSKCEIKNWEAACYDPRHAIIFYDKNVKVFGQIEICFDCNSSASSNNMLSFSECALGLKELFQEFGITYFNE